MIRTLGLIHPGPLRKPHIPTHLHRFEGYSRKKMLRTVIREMPKGFMNQLSSNLLWDVMGANGALSSTTSRDASANDQR